MRHTKIIATVGPASDSDAMIDALIAAGTDIFRLNFSHGTHDSHAPTFERIRAAAQLVEHNGINAPGVPLPTSAITPKDVDDLAFGLSLGVDLVALSFVQTADDLRRGRQLLRDARAGDVPLVAKLERPQALDHLDDILSASDAVMIARGDLGVEMPLERVPRAQKEITRAARAQGIPVIVATQVLESMTTEPRPTRAEVNDAANAVEDGVDAVMLAGETAVGAYPARTVQTLDAIIRDAESIPATDRSAVPTEALP